jgi:hypothetical protein
MYRTSSDPLSPSLQEASFPTPSRPRVDNDMDFEPGEDDEPVLDEADPDSSVFVLGVKAEEFALLLPSDSKCISLHLASDSLVTKEARLRVAQLESNLIELRHLLRIKASVYLDKKANSVGQKAGTRSTTLLVDYTLKIERVAKAYRESRAAALRIDPHGQWQCRLKELKKGDIRAAHQNEDEAGQLAAYGKKSGGTSVWHEKDRVISWIWKVPRDPGGSSVHSSLGDEALEASEEEVGEGES